MDKYHVRDFLLNIVIHNTLSICGRMAGWRIRDLRRVLGLYYLVGSPVVFVKYYNKCYGYYSHFSYFSL